MGGRSASNAAWEGHAELQRALEGLATAKGVSANRVKAVATAACQYTKDYKRVVHDVEVFLWKAEPEHRLAGLYAMDAIMRQSQGKLRAKDPFVKRFLLHMNHTISAVKKLPADQQINISHVFEEWQTRGYYTSEEIEEAGGYMYSMNNPERLKDTQQSASALKASPTHSDAASKEKLASLLSIIKKQKELHETGQQDSTNFPAGNCRFGDRCSFAHGEEDLDKLAVGKRRPSPHGSYDSRWQADDSGASAPASGYNYLASAYGGNYQGYSGPNGGQGGSNYNTSYAMPSQDSHVGNVQYTSYASSTSQPSTSGGSVTTESRPATSANGPGIPSPATIQPPRATPAAPVAPSTRVKDDDDVEASGPEFTLQYDDDD
ncbi:hypothetical protein Poli38472_009051 [Pythium oligandrum]|uniref:C3H1-type domain-containing protein n=1 Tax=Pythium oligandrum TaxID=41045 RepID=A0A8K1CJU8_PYTOL|nr:hypothetical protein Poli38472_009051 [Pythium oligandrum]|eukprot:TMW64884.1 hypothetical protein Poli38472_009051 [Pythium oligandrum]